MHKGNPRRRLFPEGGTYANLPLVDAKATPDGVLIMTYQAAEMTMGKA